MSQAKTQDAERYKLVDHNRNNTKEFETWQDAQMKMNDMVSMGASPENFEIKSVAVPEGTDKETKPELDEFEGEQKPDGGTPEPAQAEVVDETPDPDPTPEPADATDQLADRQMDTDPLDILPDFMIDDVKGTPTLNKRGLSVLAFHYDISVTDREIIVTPHETDWEYAIVETTVTNSDGNTFVGTGTAHLDRGDDKGVLLELAETRSYKRAVSFATGTGIVSYQEMIGHMEGTDAGE